MSPALALPALVPLRIRGALAWILAAGVLAATLDLLYATAFWSLRGVPAQRILQSIAAGLLGRASFDGGVRSAALGALLHYTIAMAMAFGYALPAYCHAALRRHPWRYGTLYGVLLYALMNLVVVPLSASPRSGGSAPGWIACSVLAHIALVGWPCAWFARRAWTGAFARPAIAIPTSPRPLS